ncbi:4600_t:CDS:2, partial [Gigaspora margarita]
QVIFDIIVKYIQMNHDIKLYTLNARFDPTYMCSAREFIETQDLKKLTYKKMTKGNRMVLDFEKKWAESNKTLESAKKKIVSLYKEVTNKLIQMRMNNNMMIDSVIEK